LATHVAVASVLLLGLPPLIAGMMFVMYHGKR